MLTPPMVPTDLSTQISRLRMGAFHEQGNGSAYTVRMCAAGQPKPIHFCLRNEFQHNSRNSDLKL